MRFPLVILLAAGLHAIPVYWAVTSYRGPVRPVASGEICLDLRPAPTAVASKGSTTAAKKSESLSNEGAYIPPAFIPEEAPVLTTPALVDAPVVVRPVPIEMPRFEPPPELAILTFEAKPLPRERSLPVAEKPPAPTSAASAGADAKPRGERKPPVARNAVERIFPEAARRAGQEGTATVWIRISDSGKVSEARIEQGSGYPLLDDAALDYARQLRFDPAREDGKPVESSGSFEVRYRLR